MVLEAEKQHGAGLWDVFARIYRGKDCDEATVVIHRFCLGNTLEETAEYVGSGVTASRVLQIERRALRRICEAIRGTPLGEAPTSDAGRYRKPSILATHGRRPMSERDPQGNRFIYRQAPLYAKAKAERVRLEEFRKSKKALLMAECEAPAVNAREQYAYAHPDYIVLI